MRWRPLRVEPGKAEARRDEFFPEATVYDDYRSILEREDIEVLDITPLLTVFRSSRRPCRPVSTS